MDIFVHYIILKHFDMNSNFFLRFFGLMVVTVMLLITACKKDTNVEDALLNTGFNQI